MKRLVGGNWKMMGDEKAFRVIAAFDESNFADVECFIAVPFIHIPEAIKRFPAFIQVAAQDVSKYQQGAHSGEVSARMLKDMGVSRVIVGHSERRASIKETNEEIGRKIKNALSCGMNPILCIGESKETRERGEHLEFIERQLCESIGDLKGRMVDLSYEPIWAIGLGRLPSKDEIQEVIDVIKKVKDEYKIKGHILYGGSVSIKNIEELKDLQYIGGVLVGGASLSDEFEKIAKAVGEF